MNNPRDSLAPGTYRATVTKVNESSMEYALEGCGEWRYSMHRYGLATSFWDLAVAQGWFEVEIRP